MLEAAYDDAQGVTAEFNLNALRHINEQLDANFELGNFTHQATYNEDLGAVQMHLVSQCHQQVEVASERFEFALGERLHTENSFKYHTDEFIELAARAGFAIRDHWTDSKHWYNVFLLSVSETT